MENLLEIFNNGNVLIGLFISLIGGFLASFSPCSLSTLPLIIGYVAKENDSKNSLKYSIIFSIGITVTFITLGIISVLIEKRISIYGNVINLILAIILVLVSLNLFGVIGSKIKTCKVPNKSKNLFKAFALGILGGLIDSPCTAPILIAILTFAAAQNNLFIAILFMLFYSIGHSFVIILAGTSMGIIEKISQNEKYIKIGNVLKIIFGILTLMLALYFLYLFF